MNKCNGNKNFNKILLYCEQRNSEIYSNIVDAWTDDLPTLEVVGANTNVLLRNVKTRKEQNNINFNDSIQGHHFHKLFNECGYHLILEDKASYEHLINQCQQVGSIPIALFGGANKELISNDTGFPLSCKKRKSDDEKLGSRFTTCLPIDILVTCQFHQGSSAFPLSVEGLFLCPHMEASDKRRNLPEMSSRLIVGRPPTPGHEFPSRTRSSI